MQDYEIQEQKKGLNRVAILGLLLGLTVLLVVTVYYFTKVNKPLSSDSQEIQLVIQKGMTVRQIANHLSDSQIINAPIVFEIYARLHGAGGKIQAGNYLLNADMAIPEIIDVLTQGRVVSTARNITIPEGWTNNQIGSYLATRQVIAKNSDWEAALTSDQYSFKFKDIAEKYKYEGFLFPDTYKLGKDENIETLVQKMLSNFESKFTAQMLADLNTNHRSVRDTVIMASIIEKEVGRNKPDLTDEDVAAMQRERELVASVFYNRLAAGMALESDATVNYITGKKDRSVTIADTKIKSPYNTYQVKGLPPGPISNPGLGSLRAAVNPANSQYLYFLNAPDGTAYFAKTLAEHNANKAKYLR